jgi:glycosyltransferase involved in cell wall biosynthesis
MSARICVITAGHPSTCPRMVKVADALHDAGHQVRFVSARFVPWAVETDRSLRNRRAYRFVEVSFEREHLAYWLSGLRQKVARRLARTALPLPSRAVVWAHARYHSELLAAALAEPADLYYGGTSGGLAAAAFAAQSTASRYALDLEDYHEGEQPDDGAGKLINALAGRVVGQLIHGASLVTAASDAISDAYGARYGARPLTIHNTFPLPAKTPSLTPSAGPGLVLGWFSQTIGRGRGLELAIRAMGRAGLPGRLELRGRPMEGYLAELSRLRDEVAPTLDIATFAPVAPDDLIDTCAGWDLGLALESGTNENHRLLLSNKALTYVLAGVPVALTDTPGQRAFADDLGAAAVRVNPGDIAALADGLVRLSADREQLGRARAAAWQAAARRWHWEHANDRGALLAGVERALS